MWLTFWILFGIAIVALVVYLALTLRDIWRSLMGLASVGSEFTDALSRFSATPKYGTDVVPYESESERRAQALAIRQRISDEREAGRQRRLRSAQDRWVSAQSGYETRFTEDYRDQARAQRRDAHL